MLIEIWNRLWRAKRIAVMAIVAAAAGCVGSTEVSAGVMYGYPVVYTEVAPIDIYAYPRVYYRGRYAYLVDGRWYYPSGDRWVVFTREPVALSRYRVRYYERHPYYYRSRPYPRRPEFGAPPPRRRVHRHHR